jgi:hypothetical protein
MDYLKSGLIVGALGDISLQIANKNGLIPSMTLYFEYQGPVLSVVKASLLTGFWSGVYGYLDPEPSMVRFMVYAGALDYFYRQFYPILYPSLSYYYQSYPTLDTILYNCVVAGLVQLLKENAISQG